MPFVFSPTLVALSLAFAAAIAAAASFVPALAAARLPASQALRYE
jgi:ABC-type antimicrobial peptide transport system permease subunit